MATFTKLARIYEKHESKFLNSALILYLCFGAFLFNYLGEFKVEDSNNVKVSSTTVNIIQINDYVKNGTSTTTTSDHPTNTKGRKSKQTRDLNELRLASVRRMWNITNRLNILYESNWTLLVLDELVEFERNFLESLSSEQRELSNDGEKEEEEEEGVNVEVEIEIEDEEKEKEKEKEKESSSGKKADKKEGSHTTATTNSDMKSGDIKSNRSIKKSFFHSLATITTIASPHGTPKTSTGKLATILYGTLGIPILLFTITKTGNHLAHSTLNTILIVRHYCFSIPIHYLCCSCNFYLCFRLLSWCCCCCCCSYIFCLTSDKDKAKCCDSKNAPKLKLHHFTRRRLKRSSNKLVSRYNQTRDASGAIYQGDSNQVVENVNNLQLAEQIKLSNNQQQQKSVRFSNQGGKQNLEFNLSQDNIRENSNEITKLNQNDEIDQSFEEEENLYSSGVFLASLIIVGIYLSAGAYVYSRDNNLTLVDGLFEVYALLSTSKVPEALNSRGDSKEDIMTVYKSLKSNSLIKTPSGKLGDTFKKPGKRSVDPLGIEAFVWETLYLICGLHLLSMCGHFARLWLSGKIGQELSNCQLKDRSNSNNTTCNGHIPSIIGTLNDTNNTCGGGDSNSFGEFGQIIGNIEQKSSDHYLMQASLPTSYVSSTNNQQMEPHLSINQQISDISSIQQQPQEVNLAELFVVTNQTASPADIQYTTTRQQQQQQQQQASSQQQTSDVSFASTDRSTDRGSLCLHHQAQIPNVAHTQTGAFYNPSGSTYTHQSTISQPSQASYIGLPSHSHPSHPHPHQHHHNHHHHGHNESPHLYPTLLANNVNQSMVDEGEGDDDDEEMDQMLKSCLNGTSKLPTSSSLIHLSNTQKADNCIHQHYKHQANPNSSYNKSNGFRSNHSELSKSITSNNNSNRFGSLTRDTSRLRFGLDNNNGCEQDSSLNTTADGNTLSSSSGRTVKIIRN